MKWTEERRKAHGIDVVTVSHGNMSPKFKITIDGYSIAVSITREHLEDLSIYGVHIDSYLDEVIDSEIENHKHFKRAIRKKKLEQIEQNGKTR